MGSLRSVLSVPEDETQKIETKPEKAKLDSNGHPIVERPNKGDSKKKVRLG